MSNRSNVYYGRIIDGHIKLLHRESFAALIQQLEGCEIDIQLRKHRKDRSSKQNAYYWSCVVAEIANFCGYEPTEAHDALKQMFLTDHSNAALPRVRSTTTLDTKEFMEYIEKCVQFAAEKFGIVIPDPE